MRISIVGAYGFTGKIICEELNKINYSYSIYGRDIENLNELKRENSNIINLKSINLRLIKDVNYIIENSDVIINCAGPFTEESFLLVEKVAESGKIYLDISGEIGFIKKSKDYLQEISVNNNSLIIHGCAFESLVSDLILQYLNEENEIKSVKTFYKFNQKKVSPGTRITMKLSKYRESFKIKDNQWSNCDFKNDLIKIINKEDNSEVAVPYPLPEVAFSKWNFEVDQAESFLIIDEDDSRYMTNRNIVEGDSLKELDRLRLKKFKGPELKDRMSQKCELFVNINHESIHPKTLEVKIKDTYLLTAKSIVLAVENILTKKPKLSGVVSPAKIFNGNALETIHKLGIELNHQTKFRIKIDL
jgi:short subunit dehydrogenase-like uncharacterized protein